MRIWKNVLFWYCGGMAYTGVELLWRGRSHSSMFVLGGLCFVAVGQLSKLKRPLPLPLRGLAAAGIITVLELCCGLAVNRDYGVWDYREQPLNVAGQICPAYFAAWIPLGLLAVWLYGKADGWADRKAALFFQPPDQV